MPSEGPSAVITFNNIRVNSIDSNSGIFSGYNFQYLWCSDSTTQNGYGSVIGEGNTLENPYNIVTDPDSSSELVKYLEEAVGERFGKRGM